MRKLRFLHTADLHLDSAFDALSPAKARIRREEQRDLLISLAQLVYRSKAELVLISGDLLDGMGFFLETGEQLVRTLREMAVPVFIAPGNHDYYSSHCRYASMRLPENVHVFTKNTIECVQPDYPPVRIYGAAFTDKSSPALLESFRAERTEGLFNLLCIHGDVGVPNSPYNPISQAQLAASGIDYAALGHVHKACGLKSAGNTYYSWPGCPEGRGFDETGEKYVNIVELSDEGCSIEQVSIAKRRYMTLNVDITGTSPLIAVHTALPDDTIDDIYRIILSGESETAPDLNALYASLSELFFEVQLRDQTRILRDIWERAGEDSLRGIFLKKLRALYDKADEGEKEKIEQAARWGLAALDGGEEVAVHENK